MNTTIKIVGTFVLTLLLLAVIAIVSGGSSNSTGTTTTMAGENSTTTATASTTTVPATTTTTLIDFEDVETDVVSGNLLVDELPEWTPKIYAGDLIRESWLCNSFWSESDATKWIGTFYDGEGNLDVEEINVSNDEAKIKYWLDYPVAAENMLAAINTEKPWIDEAATALMGDYWTRLNASEKLALLERATYTEEVARPTSYRTTGCDSNVTTVLDKDFRKVELGGNVTATPNDDDWYMRNVDVLLPSKWNGFLADNGFDARIQQTMDEDGQMWLQITRGGIALAPIKITESVPVFIEDDEGNLVIAEGLFSTVCGNLMLPEYQPPRKNTPTTTTQPPTTTTTVPVTTTTQPPTTTTTTTVPPTTTTTTVPPTTTTTTTVPPLTCTFKPELVGPGGGPWTLSLEREDPDCFVRDKYVPAIGSPITVDMLDGSSSDGTLKWLTVTGTRIDGSEYTTATDKFTLY